MYWLLRVTTAILLVALISAKANETVVNAARSFLVYMDKASHEFNHKLKLANFNYESNSTAENLQVINDLNAKGDGIQYVDYPWAELEDPELYRQADKYGLLISDEVIAQSDPVSAQLNAIINKMIGIQTEMTVCSYKDKKVCGMRYNPDLENIFKKSSNPKELEYYWLQYQNKLGEKIKPLYSKYVNISNIYSRFMNSSNKAVAWIKEYETSDVDKFTAELKDLYEQFKPLYVQLFVFTRKKLFDIYGSKFVNRTGALPIHLTGSLIGDDLKNLIDKILPFPKKKSPDVTPQLIKQNYTQIKMARICEDFYLSLGLPPMPDTFWNLSVFERPKDRNSTCTSTAFDLYDKKDYRILSCAQVNMTDWLVLCHEMAHVKYEMGYKDVPYCYKISVNSALNEGWADVNAFSLTSTKRLRRLRLLENPCETDRESYINKLFYQALEKIAFLPYALALELWRYDYFTGKITDKNANEAFWAKRLEFQGIKPPVKRSNAFLDAAAKIHVVKDYQYINYFFANVIQFEIHEALCTAAGEYDPTNPSSRPLDECDIYGSREAGDILKKFFALGGSKNWLTALGTITGSPKLETKSFLKYFEKLYVYLKKENARTKEYIGW